MRLYSDDSDGNIIDEAALPPMVKPHPDALSSFTIARGVERFAYWGARTMLIFYLMSKYAVDEVNEGYALFSWFIFGFAAVQVLGGLLTDLLVDARKAVVWGGLSLAVGYFIVGFSTPITDVVGALLILGGTAFYTPASISSLGRYYRGREHYLLAGMHTYQAGIFIALMLGTLFFSFSMQFIDWRQGLMLCGIVMILGHIYLLAVGRVFSEPYLPAKEEITTTGIYGGVIPVVLVIAFSLFFLLFTFSFESGSYKSQLNGSGFVGIVNWLQYLHLIAAVLLFLAGSWALTRKTGSPALRLGTGAVLCIAVLVAGVGLVNYAGSSIGNAALIIAAIMINILMGAVEVYFIPAVYTLIIQHGKKAVNTWLGLLAMVSQLPYVLITFSDAPTSLKGIFTVLATIGLTTVGLWFIKNRKRIDLPENHR